MCRSGVEEPKASAGRICDQPGMHRVCTLLKGLAWAYFKIPLPVALVVKPEANNIVGGFVTYCEAGLCRWHHVTDCSILFHTLRPLGLPLPECVALLCLFLFAVALEPSELGFVLDQGSRCYLRSPSRILQVVWERLRSQSRRKPARVFPRRVAS